MKLVEIAGVCFDAEHVLVFKACEQAEWGRALEDGASMWYPDGASASECTTVWFKSNMRNTQEEFLIIRADYATVKVAMQMALRQTIND